MLSPLKENLRNPQKHNAYTIGKYFPELADPKRSLQLIMERGTQYNIGRPMTTEEVLKMSREEMIRLASAKMWYKSMIHRNPLKGFVPCHKSHVVISSMAAKTMYIGGNGTMKTTTMVNIIGNFAYGPQNIWFQNERFQKMHASSFGRIVGTSANCQGAISKGLKKWLPRGRYKINKRNRPWDFEWTTDTGCMWEVYTYEMDKKDFEGADLDWICFDEPPPQRIWNACVQRLRQGGYIYIFMTPLEAAAWIMMKLEEDGADKLIDFTEILKPEFMGQAA